MRIVAWNLGHQTHERKVKSGFLPAIGKLQPDILILNEYVHGASRDEMLKGLANLGLVYWRLSDRLGNNNQVLIASRYELVPGDLRGPSTDSGGGESNFLHVRVPALDMDVVGLRVPSYTGTLLKKYWHDLGALVSGMAGHRIVFAGDLNADPASDAYIGGPYLAGLDAAQWQVPVAEGEMSFRSGSRIDHAIVATALPVMSATYVVELGDLLLCGLGERAISDHAPLSVELDVPEIDSVLHEPPPFANRGSQRWLQVAVNHRPKVLDDPIRTAMRLPSSTAIEWLSPLAIENYLEYRDQPTFDRLRVTLEKPLSDFWPAAGPVWDGLARTNGGDILLIEAKAHVPEMVTGGTRASAASRSRIEEALKHVQNKLARSGTVDWSGTFYQYANRLAHLYFLREENHVPAHLVYIYFLNATDVSGPSEIAEYLGALKVIEHYMGLGRHRMQKYIHKIFVDVRDLVDAMPERLAGSAVASAKPMSGATA
jgi:hypothetical protein